MIVDHEADCTILIAEAGHEPLLDAMAADLAAIPDIAALAAPASCDEDDPKLFLDGVARIHEHLHAGDIFQVNLSRAWHAHYARATEARRAVSGTAAGQSRTVRWLVAATRLGGR